jgi:DNA polymerase-3 subunit delta'
MTSSAILTATEHQPQARVAIEAAVRSGDVLSHAYLFHGPPGVGKRAAARAFAAALISAGAGDPADAQRRVASGVHPDLTWVEPRGAHEILVDDVRSQVVRQAALTPFEASRRVFVIADADRMNDESQNALLKTLEEPAPHATFILISSAPGRLLPTIPSRCRSVRFGPVPPARLAEELESGGVQPATAAACARLSGGNAGRARYLAGEGAEQRREADSAARLALRDLEDPEWVAAAPARPLLERANQAGSDAEERMMKELNELLENEPRKGRGGISKEYERQARRAHRRAHTASLDLSLHIVQLWFRDLVAVACGRESHAFNADRLDELREDAAGWDAPALIDCVERVERTRRRLERTVAEDVALEALFDALRRAAERGRANR